MEEPFVGSEVVASGLLTPYALRSRCVALYPDVYVMRETQVTAHIRALAAWLWTRRRGVLAGRSASALHRARWLDPVAPAEVNYGNRHCPQGIHTWSDTLADDELEVIGGVAVTTPARTALDIARRYPLDQAVTAIDALANATDVKIADVELLARRYRGSRGIRRVPTALDLVDGGAESPRETWVRLVLVRNGFPRPQTQIPVYDDRGYMVARLDMGWEGIKVAVEYEGDHHRTDRRQFRHDIRRYEEVDELGWIAVRITAEDTRLSVIRRVRDARARRV